MEFRLHIPQDLEQEGDLIQMWTHFSQRFGIHHSENSSRELNASQSTPSILLFAANHKIDQISSELLKKGISSTVINQVLEVVEEACLPYFLLLFERFRFFALDQSASETVLDFAESLRQQVKLCQFSDLEESILINALINGLTEEQLRQKLLKQNSTSFDDAVSMCNTAVNVKEGAGPADASQLAPVKKKRGRKRKKVSALQTKEKKLFVVPVINDVHDDVDLDDAKLIINNYKANSPKKKGKSADENTTLRGKKRPKAYKCFACNNEYRTRKSFRRHVKTKHAEIRKFHCVHCNIKFETRGECLTHCCGHKLASSSQGKGRQSSSKSKTVADTSYICWHCGESLANLAEYKEHCNIHSSAVRVYTCDICQKKNHNICRLIGHLKGHLVPRHKCEICGNCFGRPELLTAHRQTHVDQPNHQCQTCNKSFVTADRLQCHMRTHTGEKRFTCELCGKCFSQKMSFDYHKRWHAGEKPYECDICGRRTICFGDLKKHKRMHSDKRPYVCEVCGKSFRFISNLNRHRKGHTGKRLYVCQVCGRSFIYNEGLRDHIKAGRCPGLKSEVGTGAKISNRGPRPRNSNAIVSMPMMSLTVDGTPLLAGAPQSSQLQPEQSSAYITKAILNPGNASNNLAPTLISAIPSASSSLAPHQQQQHESAQLPTTDTFVQISAPPQHTHAQHHIAEQHINQHGATVTCTLPESYMTEFTAAWPQYMIRNTTTLAEGGEVGQPGTNVVIVPQFY